MPLAADPAGEPGVAHHAVDPVIQAVTQVARPGVGVIDLPAAKQHAALIGHIIAVVIFEEECFRRHVNDYASTSKRQARGDAQVIGEDREFVGAAAAARVLADDDPVAALAWGLLLVRIIHRDGNPEPAALVPVHADRLAAQVRFGGEELHLEMDRRDQVFQ